MCTVKPLKEVLRVPFLLVYVTAQPCWLGDHITLPAMFGMLSDTFLRNDLLSPCQRIIHLAVKCKMDCNYSLTALCLAAILCSRLRCAVLYCAVLLYCKLL